MIDVVVAGVCHSNSIARLVSLLVDGGTGEVAVGVMSAIAGLDRDARVRRLVVVRSISSYMALMVVMIVMVVVMVIMMIIFITGVAIALFVVRMGLVSITTVAAVATVAAIATVASSTVVTAAILNTDVSTIFFNGISGWQRLYAVHRIRRPSKAVLSRCGSSDESKNSERFHILNY